MKLLEKKRDELGRTKDINKNENVFSPWSYDAALNELEPMIKELHDGEKT